MAQLLYINYNIQTGQHIDSDLVLGLRGQKIMDFGDGLKKCV